MDPTPAESSFLFVARGNTAPAAALVASAAAGADLTADRFAGRGWYLLEREAGAATPLTITPLHDDGSAGELIHVGARSAGPQVLMFPRDVVGFRSDQPAANAALRLRPVGRPAATARMLAGLRRRDGRLDAGLLVSTLGRMAMRLLRGDVRGAGETLRVDYRRCLSDSVPGDARAGVPIALHPYGRRGRAWNALLAPVRDLHRAGGEAGSWEASADDPGFQLTMDRRPLHLEAGWYLFEADMQATDGRLVAPCLVPDYGANASQEDLIFLPDPNRSGRVAALVLLKFAVHSLRLDPSLRRARFHVGAARLVRLGRGAALAQMLAGIAAVDGRGRGPAAALRASAGFLADVPRHGLSGAAVRLFDHYLAVRRPALHSYAAWVALHDSFGPSDLKALRERAAALPFRPLVSVLVPVYDTPERWLRQCLDSVLAQAYEHWELCIADDASPAPHVRKVLAEYARRDPRIRVLHRERNGHIAAASNSALEMARGEFVSLLDHDDELRPHALLETVAALAAQPDAGLVYSDEDKIDAAGQRFGPYFKPDWNPDLLLGQNYLCHLTTLRTQLVRDVGGFRQGFDGSQDHDLFLRCIERLRLDQVVHVPKVLYHWRAIPGSTALARAAKDYAADAGRRAVDEHLQRTGVDATVEELPAGHYRVRYRLPSPPPVVSVIIPTRDRVELLRTCVESILARTTGVEYEVVVVDNRSSEPAALEYLAALAGRERVRVLRYDQPFNYSAINNFAVGQCRGDVVALVNNDIEVISPDWLAEMTSHALRPGIGAVGAMLYYPDDTIQHAGVILGIGGVANHAFIHQPRGYGGHGGRARVAQRLSAVTAACLVVQRRHYLAIGGFDEQLEVAFNDVDFCLRLGEHGLACLWTPFAELYHHESATRGNEDTEEKYARFVREVGRMHERWGDRLQRDPAYNPNLSLEDFNFEPAFPPRG